MNIDDVQLLNNDIPYSVYEMAVSSRVVSIDIETTGLDWNVDKMATCQICIPNKFIGIVRVDDDNIGNNLINIINNSGIAKIFHYAVFDLRFFVNKWAAEPSNIICTKICSKIVSPDEKDHSLKGLLKKYLNVEIDKTQRLSDWTISLNEEQIEYAVKDVLYLYDLYKSLDVNLENLGRRGLARAAFEFVPTRVVLDIIGSGDVMSY
ncbi:hypothetical protein [Desulfovibrio subterraneus]|uniref:Ribonuclease D n=1 Tax=Desulfovibrio subterraneus TaxID=2718620 RepID=A0A7J0BEX4_9BACT|nr:hypothetical protein [Desulfovibrio subterraneus]GFM32260.1 ribonuclease D [Desulfovibrio subterraneus]